jgi:hypothetical protein
MACWLVGSLGVRRVTLADLHAELAELRATVTRQGELLGRLALTHLSAQERRDAVTLVRGAAAMFGFCDWTVAEFATRATAGHLSSEFTDVIARYRDSAGELRSLGRFFSRIAGLPVCELQVVVFGPPQRGGRLYAVADAGFLPQRKHAPVVANAAAWR